MNEDSSQLGPVARRLAATERVLVIEDEPDIAFFLRAYFRAAGYDLVHLDPDGPDAVLDAVAEHQPDCLVLDVRLRGFSGLEAYRRLRADERWAFTPVIIVSAHIGSETGVVAAGGLDAFMRKPFNTNTLADLVRERIELSRELASHGRDNDVDLLTQDYLEARLADELTLAGRMGSVGFAIVCLRSLEEITHAIGTEGRNFVANALIKRARGLFPSDAVLGLTRSDELAVVFPGRTATEARPFVEAVIDDVAGTFTLPGGATVPVVVAGGLAAYPEHATDVDGLFMAADSALADAIDAGDLLKLAR